MREIIHFWKRKKIEKSNPIALVGFIKGMMVMGSSSSLIKMKIRRKSDKPRKQMKKKGGKKNLIKITQKKGDK